MTAGHRYFGLVAFIAHESGPACYARAQNRIIATGFFMWHPLSVSEHWRENKELMLAVFCGS